MKSKQKIRILLVEYDPTDQRVTLRMLKRLGYRAEVVGNGLEAIRALESIPYDLVLMGVQMAEIDCFATTRQIRHLKTGVTNSHIPIIAMSAYPMKGDHDKCLDSGMNDYVSKPVDLDELREVIVRWTSPKKEDDREACEKATDFTPHVLMDLLGGDDETYGQIMAAFLQDAPKQIQLLEEAINRGDVSLVRHQAHTLKGSSAVIGATGLEKAALRLETGSGKQDSRHALQLLNHIRVEFARFEHIIATRRGGKL